MIEERGGEVEQIYADILDSIIMKANFFFRLENSVGSEAAVNSVIDLLKSDFTVEQVRE